MKRMLAILVLVALACSKEPAKQDNPPPIIPAAQTAVEHIQTDMIAGGEPIPATPEAPAPEVQAPSPAKEGATGPVAPVTLVEDSSPPEQEVSGPEVKGEPDTSLTDLRKKVAQLEQEIIDLKRWPKDIRSEKNTRITQLETRRFEIGGPYRVKRFTNDSPDGEIIVVDDGARLVTVNLGSNERMVPGLKFGVFRIRDNKCEDKGMIEIREVQETISVGSVLEQTGTFLVGDMIGSPLYDKNKKVKFVVAGDFESRSNREMRSKIEESGGVVQDVMDISVDFCLLGSKNIGYFQNESELGVTLMREIHIVKFLMD
ncbi:MAG: hypothetical protein ABIF71_02760 [Planctomycetota bacterium]